MQMRSASAVALALGFVLSLAPANAARAQEKLGLVTKLPSEAGTHWMWVSDILLHRAAIVNGDDGVFVGQVPGGVGIIAPIRSPDGQSIYQAETYYAHGTRGARTDLVSIRDAHTLAVTGEIEIPGKRSEHTSWVAGSAISDDGRFFAVFNLNPSTSISIVDLAERRFAGEVETPGCALVFAAGPRRFFSLCADGTALVLVLDDRGVATKSKTIRFFDPMQDPVIEKGVRRNNEWLFSSFDGELYTIDVGGPQLDFRESWNLLTDADRAESWRIGGMQPLAVHGGNGRLYTLMHQGGAESHKDPGTEVWVYEIAKHARIQRIALRSPVAAFLLEQAKEKAGSLTDWLLQRALPNHGIERIAVTSGEAPQLFASTQFPPTLAVYDATSGEHVRDVAEAGIAINLVQPY
jgi:methylamine dehydrogenase heavy chain